MSQYIFTGKVEIKNQELKQFILNVTKYLENCNNNYSNKSAMYAYTEVLYNLCSVQFYMVNCQLIFTLLLIKMNFIMYIL